MHILFLSAWCPLPADNGSKVRISSLLRELGREHVVDLLAFAPELPNEAGLRELQILCSGVELLPESPFSFNQSKQLSGLLSLQPRSVVANYNQAMAAAVQRRKGCQYDLVIASDMHMAPYALLIPQTPRLLEEIQLAVLHEQYQSQSAVYPRLRYGLTWWKTRHYVRRLLRHFAGATVASEQELALLRPLVAGHLQLAIVPNGVDVRGCPQNFGAPEADTLVYPGALSYDANFDAVAFFVEAILPQVRSVRPNTRLRVTGRTTAEQIAALPNTDGVEFTGYLEDVRPTVARAWAEVVPLRKGGGTRLKVLEALAVGTPVIATSKGIEGLALNHDQHVLVADTPIDFAAATLRLLSQPELRARLAAAGQQVVREHYDWQSIGQRLNDLILSL